MSKDGRQIGTGLVPRKTELGRFLTKRRLELGLNQTQVAEAVGMCQSDYAYFEKNGRKYLNSQQIELLAKALAVEQSKLESMVPEKPKAEPKTELGKFIRQRREEIKLTLEEFAERLKMTPKQAELIELGATQSVAYSKVQPLSEALELEPSDLVKFVGATNKPTDSELGRLIRNRRKEKGISIAQLAEILGVSKQFVSSIEFGQTTLSSSDTTIEKLAGALDLDIAQFKELQPVRKLRIVKSYTALGSFIGSRRLELNLTRASLAGQSEIRPQTIALIELGKYVPRRDALDKIAKALNCEIPSELMPPEKILSRRSSAKRPKSPDLQAKQKRVILSILEYIQASNLSDYEVGCLSGVSAQYISLIRNNRIKSMGRDKLIQIIIGLGLSFSEIEELLAANEAEKLDLLDVQGVLVAIKGNEIPGIQSVYSGLNQMFFLMTMELIPGTLICAGINFLDVFSPARLEGDVSEEIWQLLRQFRRASLENSLKNGEAIKLFISESDIKWFIENHSGEKAPAEQFQEMLEWMKKYPSFEVILTTDLPLQYELKSNSAQESAAMISSLDLLEFHTHGQLIGACSKRESFVRSVKKEFDKLAPVGDIKETISRLIRNLNSES